MYLQRRNATMYMHGGTQNAREFVEHIHDSPTVNGFCAGFFCQKFMGHFFAEQTVTEIVYLDMLQQWLMPQLQEDKADYILQDGLPLIFLETSMFTLMLKLLVVGLVMLLEMTTCFFCILHAHLT